MYFHFYGDTSLFIAGNLLLNLLSNFIWFYLCDYGFSYTLALRAMAIGANLSCVRFGTWIDHLITEETQTWATNITEKLNLMMRNSFVVIAKMIKNDFKWRGHVVPSDCNPVIWNFTRGWFITLTWPSIVDKHHGDIGEWTFTVSSSLNSSWSHRLSSGEVSVFLYYFKFFLPRSLLWSDFPRENCSIQCTRSGTNEQDSVG